MNFFKNLFGGKKKANSPAEELVQSTLEGILEKGGLELNFDISQTEENGEPALIINFDGADEELMKEKEGQLIESFQLLLKRVIQHHLPDDRTNIIVDCNGYREESSQALVELADKLKGIALEKGKPVYFRALSPKDRKIIHQYLAGDERVKSRSIGDGLYKKIKIYPIKGGKDNANFESAE